MFPSRRGFSLAVNPTDHEEIREWPLRTIRPVVDEPEDVTINAIPGEERTTFRIKVSAGDKGKVIGRQGRTSQSLRVLAGASGCLESTVLPPEEVPASRTEPAP